MKKLKELNLKGNLFSRRFNYRYDVLTQITDLRKFDGDKLFEADFELAKNYQKILWKVDDKVQELERPGTAPQGGPTNNLNKHNDKEGRYANKLRNLNKTNTQAMYKQNMANHIIFEEDNIEKITELQENNQILKEKLGNTNKDNLRLQGENDELTLKNESLVLKNKCLEAENKNIDIILDENKNLKEKIERLEK